ncbi:putative uncharacterized protein [Agathobacter rectalis CAG:36]|uniref:Uncharacterized protein n=1 Tax=Agathobacter rectalis CAG:36 TaxID=1263079 RepID=R6TQT4_9FIRM|nr:putative uncharacterized protein [Agathobacter rectalis CAG:36]
MLYEIYQNVCVLIIKVLNMRVPWSGSIQPTIAEIIVFSLAAILIIKFIRGLLE